MRPHDLKYLRVKRWIHAAVVVAVVAVVADAAAAAVAAAIRIHLHIHGVAVFNILATSDTSLSASTTVINVSRGITTVLSHSIANMTSTTSTIDSAFILIYLFIVLITAHSTVLSAVLVIKSTSTAAIATATSTVATATVATSTVANVI